MLCAWFLFLVPEQVQPPYLIEAGGTYVHLGWDEPLRPNGILLGYILYKGDVVVYNGVGRQHNETGLLVWLCVLDLIF